MTHKRGLRYRFSWLDQCKKAYLVKTKLVQWWSGAPWSWLWTPIIWSRMWYGQSVTWVGDGWAASQVDLASLWCCAFALYICLQHCFVCLAFHIIRVISFHMNQSNQSINQSNETNQSNTHRPPVLNQSKRRRGGQQDRQQVSLPGNKKESKQVNTRSLIH